MNGYIGFVEAGGQYRLRYLARDGHPESGVLQFILASLQEDGPGASLETPAVKKLSNSVPDIHPLSTSVLKGAPWAYLLDMPGKRLAVLSMGSEVAALPFAEVAATPSEVFIASLLASGGEASFEQSMFDFSPAPSAPDSVRVITEAPIVPSLEPQSDLWDSAPVGVVVVPSPTVAAAPGILAGETVYLVDISAYIYRGFYATKPVTNSKGVHTNAVMAMGNTLRRLLRELEPRFLAAVFDAPGPSFRNAIYPEYKANRAAKPPELESQFPLIRRLVEAMGIACLEVPGYEADDLIATAVPALEAEGAKVVVVTGDKDLMQVVSEATSLLDTDKQSWVSTGLAEVAARFGGAPSCVPEVLGLAGDSSDNIPGVPGIGEKTATDLIVRFGSLERLYGSLAEVSGPKRKQSLADHKEQAFLSRTLATCSIDAPLRLDINGLLHQGLRSDLLKPLLQELELRQLANTLGLGENSLPPVASGVVELYADGGANPNPGPGAYGTILRLGSTEKTFSGFSPETTNNQMELTGVIVGLRSLRRPCRVRVVTDSQYVVKGITEWIRGWKARGWVKGDGQPVINRELWEELDQLAAVHQIEWRWIEGHSGHTENERCDAMCTETIKKGKVFMETPAVD